MDEKRLWEEIQALPPVAQRLVAEFVALLRLRYANDAADDLPVAQVPLEEEPFVGMWADREDMQDSAAWVRSVREQEWRH